MGSKTGSIPNLANQNRSDCPTKGVHSSNFVECLAEVDRKLDEQSTIITLLIDRLDSMCDGQEKPVTASDKDVDQTPWSCCEMASRLGTLDGKIYKHNCLLKGLIEKLQI
jgi:hypothetical protein